jgi:DNA-binding winged helix-turn-helix (wHTH) protein
MAYRFELFALDVPSRRLTWRDRVVPLVPKAFDLLVLLVEARPRVLSKSELHQHLWPDTHVSDGNLSGLIALLRDALRDNARKPRFIRTAHRVGYAFSGMVETDAPVQSDASQRSTGCWLTLPNRQFALAEGENIVGRDAQVDVALEFPGVSRRHARIVVSAGTATIDDLGSKNGTWVRGQRLTIPRVLHDGDDVKVGSMVVIFRAVTAGLSTATESASGARDQRAN